MQLIFCSDICYVQPQIHTCTHLINTADFYLKLIKIVYLSLLFAPFIYHFKMPNIYFCVSNNNNKKIYR